MRKVWIVVANSTQARIFRAENVNHLIEIQTLVHSEMHMSDRDLVSDKPGITSDRTGFARNTMEEQTPQKVKERTHFAEQIAKMLEEAFFAAKFERLYVVANSPFLGFLRQSLSLNVSKLIESEIHKDLTHMKADEVRAYLPPVL